MCLLWASLLPLQLEHFCYLYWLFLLLVLTFILYFVFYKLQQKAFVNLCFLLALSWTK